MCSRMRTSSRMYEETSFFPAYQFDFQSWMTPTRRPPGWIFWPITGSPSLPWGSRLLRSRPQPQPCGFGGLAGGDRRRRLHELDRDVTGALHDAADAAARAGAVALDRRPLVCVRRGDDELVAVPVQVRTRLGVRDGRVQHPLDVARDGAVGEREDRPRFRHRAAADEVGDEPRLAGARAHEPRLRADGLLPFCLDCRHYLLTFACLSPAWPRNVRV